MYHSHVKTKFLNKLRKPKWYLQYIKILKTNIYIYIEREKWIDIICMYVVFERLKLQIESEGWDDLIPGEESNKFNNCRGKLVKFSRLEYQ